MDTPTPFARIRFTDTGSGPVLVLMPGLGLNTHIFDPLVEQLARSFRCICLEFSGDAPTKRARNCTIQSLACEVHDFLRVQKLQPHAVIGHSLGGFVAMHLHLLAPKHAPNLVLIASAAQGAPSLFNMFMPNKQKQSAKALLQHNMEMCVPQEFRSTPGFKQAVAAQQTRSGSGKCFIPLLRAATQFNLLDKLPQINSPTLIVCGKEDPIAPAAQTQLLATTIPHAQSVCFAQVGHLPQLEAPGQTAQAIINFLTS